MAFDSRVSELLVWTVMEFMTTNYTGIGWTNKHEVGYVKAGTTYCDTQEDFNDQEHDRIWQG
jgi:hypothetical protein